MKAYHTALLALLFASLGLVSLTAPALADPRGDVISGSQRCSDIADGHTWLDCYYGAAQPMRAQLGLPPAPAAQVQLVPAYGVSSYTPPQAAAPALAGPRGDVLSGSQRCLAIADNRVWLDCYYGAAQPMRAQLGLPPAPAAQVQLVPPAYGAPAYAPQAYAPQAPAPVYGVPAYGIPVAPPAYGVPAYGAPTYGAPAYGPQVATAPAPPPMPRRRNSGFFSSVFGNSKPVVANLHMAAYSKNHDGKFVVTLTDGEVWEQDPGDDADETWRKPAERYVVNVYDGALGSYNMEVVDDSQLYKVHRVK